MNNNRLPPRLDLETHLYLADMISYFTIKLYFREIKYKHSQAHQMLNIVEKSICDKYEEISKLIKKARKCKKRIRTSDLVRIFSLLDDDYCRVDDSTFDKYGFIYVVK